MKIYWHRRLFGNVFASQTLLQFTGRIGRRAWNIRSNANPWVELAIWLLLLGAFLVCCVL